MSPWFIFGFLIQNLLALEIILGTSKNWNYVQLISIVFLIPEIVCFKWIPESIGFLQNLGKIEQVKEIAHSLYGTENLSILGLDFDQKSSENQNISTTQISWKNLRSNPTLLKCSIFVIIYCIFDMSTGVITFSFYSTEIIRSFEFSTLTSQLFTMLLTFLRLLASLVGSVLTRKIKRKFNLQISIIGILIFNTILFILGFFGKNSNQKNSVIQISELVSMIGMAIFFNLGVHSILCVLPEFVPTQFKMLLSRVRVLASDVTMLIQILVFPIILKKIDHYVFAIFMVFN